MSRDVHEDPLRRSDADRKFYDLTCGNDHRPKQKSSRQEAGIAHNLLDYIYQNVVGNSEAFSSPYGRRQVVYTDYTASGKALNFIENFILNEVLPVYGNTHTTTSVTSLQTTLFRHEARDIIRNAVKASEHDAVIFVGSGATAAVHKLIHVLNLTESPVVFVGPFEHHSNVLPWKEAGALVVRILETAEGKLDEAHLEKELNKYRNHPGRLIGSFSAASNITGIVTETNSVSALLHRYNALAFWDYACGGPYLPIVMNPVETGEFQGLAYKDAVFLSGHKFVGGIDSPGILIAKKQLFQNPIPFGCGGGTVFFVSRETHRYLQDVEMREEGGTPSIVGSIRAGLAFQLKESVSTDVIMQREKELSEKAMSVWGKIPGLVLLGPQDVSKLPIFSFLVRHMDSGFFLHHNFVSVLLNDLFGIQTRGGCACSGPYAQDLLGIDEPLAQTFERILAEDRTLDRTHLRRREEHSEREILRPGFTRLNLPYFIGDEDADFIIQAVALVAREGWKLMPLYIFNSETGEWKHHSHQVFRDRKWLGSISYETGQFSFADPKEVLNGVLPKTKDDCLDQAKELFTNAKKLASKVKLADQEMAFDSQASELRWMLLPSEAKAHLFDERRKNLASRPLPFEPRLYRKGYQNSDSGNTKLVKNGTTNGISCDAMLCELNQKVPQFVDKEICRWHAPDKSIFKPFLEAVSEFGMIQNGDRVLVCLSGGKDSLSLLHTMRQYQFYLKTRGVTFDLGAVTVDPKSPSYDPSSLKVYLAALDVPYFYEEQGILEQAGKVDECKSICSFCSRMKRGRIYASARRNGYNVLAMGQHLDDLAESFFMSVFHNGRLRTMKANYTVKEKDLRVIRPFVYVREKNLRKFAETKKLPVIPENCPACFEAPKERHRVKQMLAQQEVLFPKLFFSLRSTMAPLVSINRTGVESQIQTWMKHLSAASDEEMEKDIL